jgi:hypothetical protein
MDSLGWLFRFTFADSDDEKKACDKWLNDLTDADVARYKKQIAKGNSLGICRTVSTMHFMLTRFRASSCEGGRKANPQEAGQ